MPAAAAVAAAVAVAVAVAVAAAAAVVAVEDPASRAEEVAEMQAVGVEDARMTACCRTALLIGENMAVVVACLHLRSAVDCR